AFVHSQSQQPSERITVTEAPDDRSRVFHQPPCVIDQRVSFSRQTHARSLADEQPGVQRSLQLPDPLRHAWLRQAQLAPRRLKTSQPRDCLESPYLRQGHVHRINLSRPPITFNFSYSP